MHHIVATAAAASLALLVAPSPSDSVSLTFSPDAGTRVERSIVIESAIAIGDLSVVMGGQPVPQMYLPDITVEIEARLAAEITDRFISPEGDLQGHPRVREIIGAEQSVHVAMGAGDAEGMEDSETEAESGAEGAGETADPVETKQE